GNVTFDLALSAYAIPTTGWPIWSSNSTQNWTGTPIQVPASLPVGDSTIDGLAYIPAPNGTQLGFARANITLQPPSGSGGPGPGNPPAPLSLSLVASPSNATAPVDLSVSLAATGGTTPYNVSVCLRGPSTTPSVIGTCAP